MLVPSHCDIVKMMWYLQLPAYEFDFSDVNPPVHAWACLQVYHKQGAEKDIKFLKYCFEKLLLNYSWYVKTKFCVMW